jgi:hypothetical protein
MEIAWNGATTAKAGSGVCQVCGGNGVDPNDMSQNCPRCNQKKTCQNCGGSGCL